jgi:Domain of unknown function (DUF1906)
MSLVGSVIQAPDGSKWFDCDTIVGPQVAMQFKSAGYTGAIRYIGRHATAVQDIRVQEAETILNAGLGLMLVQHVQSPGWIPDASIGHGYGAFAADSATAIGYLPGAIIWLDMEGVKPGNDIQATLDYCNNWIEQVSHAGFTPGCYIGYEPGLTGMQFYHSTHFESFWRAYNGDVVPVMRGFMMNQHTELVMAGIHFDPNTVQKDNMGMLPLMLAPVGWTPIAAN